MTRVAKYFIMDAVANRDPYGLVGNMVSPEVARLCLLASAATGWPLGIRAAVAAGASPSCWLTKDEEHDAEQLFRRFDLPELEPGADPALTAERLGHTDCLLLLCKRSESWGENV